MVTTVNLRLSPTAQLPVKVQPVDGQAVNASVVVPAEYGLPGTDRGQLHIDPRNNWTVARLGELLQGLYALPGSMFRLVQSGLKLQVGVQPTQFGETSTYLQTPDTITLARHMSPEDNIPLVLDRIFDSMWANIKHPTSTEAVAKAGFLGQMRTMHRTQRTRFDAMVMPHATIDPIAQVEPANELLSQLGTRTERLLRRELESNPTMAAGFERLYRHGLDAYVRAVTDQYTGITARELTTVIRDADALDMQPGMEGASNRLLFQFIHPRTEDRPDVFQSLFKQLMVAGKVSVISTILTEELRAAVRSTDDAFDISLPVDPEQNAVLTHFADVRAWIRHRVLGNDDMVTKMADGARSLV